MSRYDIVWFHGKRVDKYTRQALQQVEKDLGYELTIVQGSYNKGVGASAGTHDSGGVVDLAPFDWQRKVKALRKRGFAAWYRPELWIGGRRIWGSHIHAVQIGNAKLHWTAANQVTDYRNHLNGLANKGWDSFWRPKKIKPFVYNGGSSPSTPGTPSKGLFGMSANRTLYRRNKIKLKKGQNRIIPLSDKYKGGSSLMWNPSADINCTSDFYISGVTTTSSIAARYAVVKGKSNKVIRYLPITELGGTTGKDHDQMTQNLSLKKGERLRIQLTAYQDGVEVYYARHFARWA